MKQFIFILFTVIGSMTFIVTQIPSACVYNATLPRHNTCCPTDERSGLVCGGQQRGNCVSSDNADLIRLPISTYQIWHTHMFTHRCACEGNFTGYMCHECKFGFYGTHCDIERTLIRKDVHSLNAFEQRRLQKGFELTKSTISDYIVKVHGQDRQHSYKYINVYDYYSFQYTSHNLEQHIGYSVELDNARQKYIDGAQYPLEHSRDQVDFLIWHRYFLLNFEREIQKLLNDETFALPYWNWTASTSGCDVCVNKLMGATNYSDPLGQLDRRSVFADWRTFDLRSISLASVPHSTITRTPPTSDSLENVSVALSLPSMQEVVAVLHIPSLESQDEHTTGFGEALQGYWKEDLYSAYSTDNKPGCRHPGVRSVFHMSRAVHAYMNGTMSQEQYAASDPLFFLHYAYVDLLFDTWIRSNHSEAFDGTEDVRSNQSLAPIFSPITNVLLSNSDNFGYRYNDLHNFLNYVYNTTTNIHSNKQQRRTDFDTNSTTAFILTVLIGVLIVLPLIMGLIYNLLRYHNLCTWSRSPYSLMHTPNTPSLEVVPGNSHRCYYGSLDEKWYDQKVHFFLQSGSDEEYLDSGHFTRRDYQPVPYFKPHDNVQSKPVMVL